MQLSLVVLYIFGKMQNGGVFWPTLCMAIQTSNSIYVIILSVCSHCC